MVKRRGVRLTGRGEFRRPGEVGVPEELESCVTDFGLQSHQMALAHFSQWHNPTRYAVSSWTSSFCHFSVRRARQGLVRKEVFDIHVEYP